EAALSIMPDTYSQKDRLKIRRAQRALESGNFPRALELFRGIQNLSSHYDPEMLYLFSVTGDEKSYEAKLAVLENEGAIKGEVKLPVWLHRVRNSLSDAKELEALESELADFVAERDGYRDQSYGLFNLALILGTQGKTGEAVATLRRVDFTESFLASIADSELSRMSDLHAAWTQMTSERKEAESITEELNKAPRQVELDDRRKPTESDSDLEYVCQSELENESRMDWADFLAPNRLLRAGDQILELLNVDLESRSVETIDSIALDADAGDYTFQLSGTHLFLLRYNSEKIIQYDLGNDRFELVASYSHAARNSRYRLLGVHDGHLYASAGPGLEVFPIGGSAEVPLSRVIFKLPDESVYFIAGYKNILYAGSNDVTMIDVKDPANPRVLSRLLPFSSSVPHEVQFWDHFMLADYLYDITDPASPKQIDYICRDHAPLRIFSSQKTGADLEQIPGLFTCGDDEGMLRQIVQKNGEFSDVQVWRNVMDEQREFPKRSVYPMCSMICEDHLVAVNRDEIFFFKSLPVETSRVIDAQSNLETAVKELIHEFESSEVNSKTKPGGIRIILESYGAELRLLPEVSIPSAPNITPLIKKHLFYSRDFPDFEDGNVQVDDEKLVDFCLSLPELQQWTAARFFISVSRRPYGQVKLNDPCYREAKGSGNSWNPARTRPSEVELPESPEDILKTKNANLWKTLRESAASDDSVLKELLHISLQESPEQDEEVNIAFAAVRAISRIPDPVLVRNIFLAGITGNLEDLKASELRVAAPDAFRDVRKESISADYLYILLTRLWDSPDIHFDPGILKSVLANIGGEMAAVLAFRLEQWENEDLRETVKEVLENPDFHYYSFRGEDGAGGWKGPDLALLPASVLEPHRELLRKRLQEVQDSGADIDTLIPFWHMLTVLGEPPGLEELAKKNLRAKDYLEGSSFSFDDKNEDPESPDAFSVNLESRLRVQEMHNRLQRIQGGENIPLYSEDWEAEPFRRSWTRLWSALLDYGEKVTGDRAEYQEKILNVLEKNLAREEKQFAGDLTMSLRFLDYVLTRIMEDPSIAEASSRLFNALDEQKHRLPENENFRSLKQKGLLSILQSAWNDVKEKNFIEAHRKCDAILSMDSSMGQAYFLKGRLIWLEQGIPAYLVQAEDFYRKATGDRAGLARLYNMTGCAYDELKDRRKAISYFEKAAAEVPEEAMYIANIAECYYKLKDSEKALQYARQAQKKGANSEIVQEILANSGVNSGTAK
ncbi:MAG TPA: hypothetical protein DEA96_10900, partial [Leptospiraceae bacterium]|nr:hypothetical protein [Leptospiraceae bacterium]